MATVTEAVKESLIGTVTPGELSPTSRVIFLQYAKQDGDDEERYMGEEEFLNAIAPQEEDYVSHVQAIHTLTLPSAAVLA